MFTKLCIPQVLPLNYPFPVFLSFSPATRYLFCHIQFVFVHISQIFCYLKRSTFSVSVPSRLLHAHQGLPDAQRSQQKGIYEKSPSNSHHLHEYLLPILALWWRYHPGATSCHFVVLPPLARDRFSLFLSLLPHVMISHPAYVLATVHTHIWTTKCNQTERINKRTAGIYLLSFEYFGSHMEAEKMPSL